jgi:general secretion pathway protein L
MPSDRSFSMGQVAASLAGFAQRTGATGFLRWWAAELAPLVPAPARGAVARRRLRPVVAFGGDTAALWRPVTRGGAVAMERVADVPLEGEPAAVAAAGHHAIASIARVAYGGVTGTPRVRIAIPASAVLRRTLALPSAVEENLRQAIGYELDRLTPFKADELYYDAVIASRDAARGTIAVDFAAVRRPVVDAAIAHVAGWGAEVHSVSPDDPSTSSPSRLNLMPDESRVAPAPWKRWQFWAPLAGLALVAAVAVVLPVWQKRDYAIAVINKADAARQQAAVSERLRAELERAAADYHFALERKYAWPPIVRVLDTVTRALPDDTWLTQLEIRTLPKGRERDREIVMRGESANAGRLIPVLEETGIVAQVAPRSPTTKIQPGPGEIFDLGAQLKPLPRPAMVALVGPDAPPPKPAVSEPPSPPVSAASPAAASPAASPAAAATPAAASPASEAAPAAAATKETAAPPDQAAVAKPAAQTPAPARAVPSGNPRGMTPPPPRPASDQAVQDAGGEARSGGGRARRNRDQADGSGTPPADGAKP